jgi:uncharacterized OsmC-like protein
MRFSVSTASPSGMLATHVTATGSLRSDEPHAMGGTESAPNPIEVLLAAWTGCLVASARLAAMERGLTLGELRVKAEAELDPRSVGGDREAPAGLLAARAELSIEARLSDPDVLKEEIERRCPVSQTLRRTDMPLELTLKTGV